MGNLVNSIFLFKTPADVISFFLSFVFLLFIIQDTNASLLLLLFFFISKFIIIINIKIDICL